MKKNKERKDKEKKPFKSFEEYYKELEECARNAPPVEQILEEFERGDFSSLDPDCLKEKEGRKEKATG